MNLPALIVPVLLRFSVLWCGALCLMARPVDAQCASVWQANGGLRGVNGLVHAIASWDPDGPGPMPGVIVAGGDFTIAGSVFANHVAIYDPATDAWSPLGSGVDDAVYALATMPSGELVVGGAFGAAGGLPANRLARWDGTSWSTFGAWAPVHPQARVRALAVDTDGALFVGGTFVWPQLPTRCVVRWDGSAWDGLLGGVFGEVLDLATIPTGGVVAVGQFSTAGGVSANSVAVWNGATWSPLGSGWTPTWMGRVKRVCVLPNGDIVVAGSFAAMGGVAAPNIARWDGSAWHAMGSGLPSLALNGVAALAVDSAGRLVAGGTWLQSGGGTIGALWSWNGTGWAPLGGAATEGLFAFVDQLCAVPSGDLFVGATLRSGAGPGGHVSRWDGSMWHGLGRGTDLPVHAAVVTAGGEAIIAGGFTMIAGTPAVNVARWNGTQWLAMGAGLPALVTGLATTANGRVFAVGTPQVPTPYSLAEWDGSSWLPHHVGWSGQPWSIATTPAGELLVMGDFVSAAGVPALNIARHDGVTWRSLGAGLSHPPSLLGWLRNGSLLVACRPVGSVQLTVHSWDGAVWRQLGGTFAGRELTAVELPDGQILVGGDFQSIGGEPSRLVARWDGVQWNKAGDGLPAWGQPYVTDMRLRRDGSAMAVVQGLQGGVAQLARWEGADWVLVEGAIAGHVADLRELPGGDILVHGSFQQVGGITAAGLARWNGSTWSAVGIGPDLPASQVVAMPNGDLLFAGGFHTVGGVLSGGVAWLRSGCAASVAPTGAACGNPAAMLAATHLPWLGETFRSQATGLHGSTFAVVLWGGSGQQVALSTLLPQGVVGCDVLVQPDAIELALPVTGVVDSAMPIPASPWLLGQSVRQQVLPVQLDDSGSITAVSSSNALIVTIGAW